MILTLKARRGVARRWTGCGRRGSEWTYAARGNLYANRRANTLFAEIVCSQDRLFAESIVRRERESFLHRIDCSQRKEILSSQIIAGAHASNSPHVSPLNRPTPPYTPPYTTHAIPPFLESARLVRRICISPRKSILDP
jgi:hypothetical protein